MDEKHVPYRDSKLTRLLQVIRKGGSADVEQKSIHKHMIFDLVCVIRVGHVVLPVGKECYLVTLADSPFVLPKQDSIGDLCTFSIYRKIDVASGILACTQESLGGNSRTTLLVNIAGVQEHAHETLQSLQFASRAMNVRVKPQVSHWYKPKAAAPL
eukprot:1158309-Pelagomonas_calceolata.AAC.5